MSRIIFIALPLLLGACGLLEMQDEPDKTDSFRLGFVNSTSIRHTSDSYLFSGSRDEKAEGNGWSLGWEHRFNPHVSSMIAYRSFSMESRDSGSSGTATGGEVGVRGYLLDEKSWSPFASLSMFFLGDIPFASGEDSFLLYSLEVGLQWRPTASFSFEALLKTFKGDAIFSLSDEKHGGNYLELAASAWF